MAIIEADVTTMQVAMAFDYGQIDEGIRDEVREAAKSIRAYGQSFKGSMVQIGKRLIEVKGMLDHGQFGEWIEAEFDMSDRMARNFMNVARRYDGKSEIISVLSDTVMCLLAAPSTPEAARVEVEQAALNGQRVRVKDAKKAAAKFTEPKPSKPRAEVKRVAEPYEAPKPTPTPAKVVYTEPKPEPVAEVETWAAGAVGLDRDWTEEEFDAYAEANEVIVPKPTLDPVVAQLIDPAIAVWTAAPGGLTWAVTHATVEQLQAALTLLPDALRKGRGPVLEAAIKKLGGAPVAVQPEPMPEPEPIVEPKPQRPGILTREWVIFVLTNAHPTTVDFATALKAATPDDLREAMAGFDQEEKHWRARLDAIKARFDELMAPDPRIAQAREGIDLINACRVWVRDNYLELTGLEVNTLGYWRDTAGMLERLESLVGILTGKEASGG